MLALDNTMVRTRGRIPLAEIDAAVAARLGPARVPGNAQPAVFSRQVAMYLASQVGGWSTTRIGKFYNGRDHSTICHAIGRIKALRETDPEVDGLLTVLASEIRQSVPRKMNPAIQSTARPDSRTLDLLLDARMLDAIAERIACRILHLIGAGRADDDDRETAAASVIARE